MNDVATPVGKNLNFDVPGVGKAFFQVNFIVAERHFGFRTANLDEFYQLLHVLSDSNSAPSAPCNCLDHYRETVGFGKSRCDLFSFHARRENLCSGDHGNSCFRHDPACHYLAAHINYDLRGRSHKNQTGLRAPLRKSRIFGQETVTGVYRFSPAALRRLYDTLDVEVVAPWAASDANGFIGEHDMHRRLVCLFVDGHSLYSKLLGGAHYADSDLAPVCNE